MPTRRLSLTLGLAAALATLAPARATEPSVARPPIREQGALVLDGVPEIPKELSRRLSQYQNSRGASFAGWDAQGRLLMTTRFGDTAQVHRVERPGGDRRQLSFFEEPVRGVRAWPGDASKVMVVLDSGGGEFFQFHLLDLATGRDTLLTDGGRSRNESAEFSRAGDQLAYVSTRRNGTDFDVWIRPLRGGEPRLVKELTGQWNVLDWSPDDRQLLLLHYVSADRSSLHVLDLATNTLREVRPSGDKAVSYAAAQFLTRDALVVSSDEEGEFKQLARIDLASGQRTLLAPSLKWDVENLEVSADGKQLAYEANEGGTSALYLAPAAKPEKARRVTLPKGVLSRMEFDAAARRLAFSFNGATSPDDSWSVDVKSLQLTRWTQSEVGGLDPATFVSPELVTVRSFDGLAVPAWYYRPRGPGPHPVIIHIHGGPESQSVANFFPAAQAWVAELGAAVLLPNVRGSTGYGRSYLQRDNGLKREDSVRDIGALLDWVATRPELDAGRAAVIGGSYGGFMTLASLVMHGDRLRCGVDMVGISHFVTFLEHTEGYRRDLRRAEYGDERDPEMRAFLERISPLTNAGRINKPLLVAQGANDPRVPASEADQIVRTVRGNGGEVWYLLARDEGHGFSRKRNRDTYNNAVSLFFQKCLLPKDAPVTSTDAAAPAAR